MVFRRNCSLSVLSSSPLFSPNSFSLPSLLVFLFFLSLTYHLSILSSSASLLPFCSVSLPPSDSLSFLILFSFISFLFLYIQNVSSFSFYICKTCLPSFIKNFCHHSSIFPFYHTILIFFYCVCARFFIYEYFFFLAVLYFFFIITMFILSYIIIFPISPLSVKCAM